MPDTPSSNTHHASFESIRRKDEYGNEFWSARELAPLLEYQQWRNFLPVIDKARRSCETTGNPISDHFAEVRKMVDIGSGAQRPVSDIYLSRYACYLIVQNGDPSKPVIANGQTYFAIQTRRQELEDSQQFSVLSEDTGVESPLDYNAAHLTPPSFLKLRHPSRRRRIHRSLRVSRNLGSFAFAKDDEVESNPALFQVSSGVGLTAKDIHSRKG